MNAAQRRLLVVVYEYPPSPSVAAVRWWTMTRYLRAMGHSVTVLTSDAFGPPTAPDPVPVARPRSLETAWPLGRVRPAPRVGWMPFALRAARRLLREEAYDCVVTSSPPESAHLVGLLLGRRRPAWVADFRDGWCFEPYTVRFRRTPQQAVDRRLERRVALAAEVVIGATPPIADDLVRRLGARARWIPNGWDPDAGAAARSAPSESGGGACTIVYTGRLWGPRGRTPEPFFRALRAVQSAPGAPPVRLVHAGEVAPQDRALIESTGVSPLVEHVGVLDRRAVIALQRSADVLLLITSSNSSEATGKLFEYLGAGRPILALAGENEAARVVRETRTGVVVPGDDVEAIADALRRAARGELARGYAPVGVERYAYPHLAAEVVEAIEEAVSLRERSRDRG
jgi:glycosyltransferase involved in cell wall biosynthesis